MKIKKYTLRFVALGKDKKTYLRYYVTNNGEGESYNIPCDVLLSAEQLEALNKGELGGMIQKNLYHLREKKRQAIERFAIANNTYPMAEQLKIWDKAVFSTFNIDYWIKQYMHDSKKPKPSSKRVYAYALSSFKTYYINNLFSRNVEEIISKDTINKFGNNLEALAKLNSKNITAAHIHNYQSIVIRFLNYVAGKINIPKIEFFLNLPAYSGKWHIDNSDYDRLLKHKPKTKTEAVVLDIIRINSLIGLRIGELLAIEKDNVTIADDCIYIRFIEKKKTKERTIVLVDNEAMNLIKKYVNKSTEKHLWSFQKHNWFNVVLRNIAKDVFKEETVKVYKNTINNDDYVDMLKYNAISSHSFRRYAIERNIVRYGIEVARTFSGHTDTRIMFKHYADYLNAEDLKQKLLQKKSN